VPQATPEALTVIDTNRVTEDGAEGVALAFVHAHSGWAVVRRGQRGGFADWILSSTSQQRMLALEVSGTVSEERRNELNRKVSMAILRAERLADAEAPDAGPGGAETQIAYAEVSRWEEALAALHPADRMEGAIARLGAVTAALRAGDETRAWQLARRYLAEPALDEEDRGRIREAFTRVPATRRVA